MTIFFFIFSDGGSISWFFFSSAAIARRGAKLGGGLCYAMLLPCHMGYSYLARLTGNGTEDLQKRGATAP